MSHHDETVSERPSTWKQQAQSVTVTGCGPLGQYDSPQVNVKRNSLTEHRNAMVIYLRSKTDVEDWHAVADAACDLREIDAKLEVLK